MGYGTRERGTGGVGGAGVGGVSSHKPGVDCGTVLLVLFGFAYGCSFSLSFPISLFFWFIVCCGLFSVFGVFFSVLFLFLLVCVLCVRGFWFFWGWSWVGFVLALVVLFFH